MEKSLYIHGEMVAASGARVIENINPATAKITSTLTMASIDDADKAIKSSQQGFEVWSAMSNVDRSRILHKAALLLREKNDELARLEVIDTGKPLQEALAVDVSSGADCIEYYANLCASLHGEQHDLPNALAYTRREPLGVCLGIGAWNYPLQIACWKSAPALACGNAMVFKPSEMTPTTALELAKIYKQAGVPDGVFNVVQGDGEIGQYLAEHKDIAKVSITGEVNTGKKVMASAAKTLKSITMELGGKSPLIIFEDADIDNAVSAALLANFYTQGEICSNGTRVFVHQSIYNEFLNRLRNRTEKLVLGDPMDMNTQVGCQISKEHMEKVKNYIELGIAEGAVLACGGGAPRIESCPEGAFIEPTVFSHCKDDMTIVKEEIFGPVLSLLSFETEDEVLARANNIDEGLAAGVFTKDLARAHRVVAKLQAGICWVNNYNITPIEIPFGGYKQSGIGRENGLVTIEHYTQIKSVYIEMGDVDCPYQ